MEIISPEINRYAEMHSSSENEVLARLNRETNAKVLMPRMLSGHLQGRMLSMISHMIRPERVLEIGTYTGYSALCLAEGLRENGRLHTIDINEELTDMVKRYIEEGGMSGKIITHVGNALSIIPELDEQFDLVFIDADKVNYSAYYDLVFEKVRNGGYILADNVLWSGEVLKPAAEMDPDTKAINGFNKKILADKRVEHLLLPLRDGIMIIRKL